MKATVKRTVEISMSEEEAIRLGSEIESIISEINAMIESKVSMSTANSVRAISDSVGPASSLHSLFDMLIYLTRQGSISAS